MFSLWSIKISHFLYVQHIKSTQDNNFGSRINRILVIIIRFSLIRIVNSDAYFKSKFEIFLVIHAKAFVYKNFTRKLEFYY